MSLQTINLRKLLRLMYLPEKELITALRGDIRDDINKERGHSSGGGDFYAPFWKDAKDHVFGYSDLESSTADRIKVNGARRNLYPRLKDGFLIWWNDRRRWTNAPFVEIDVPKARYKIKNLDLTIKIDCVLSVQDGSGEDHYIYPYWFPLPIIEDEPARLGLWMLAGGLSQVESSDLRLLDVMRGRTFSLERNGLKGDEERLLADHFHRLMDKRNQILREYDKP